MLRVLVLAGVLLGSGAIFADDLTGEWVGIIQSPLADMPLRVRFSNNSGTVLIPFERVIDAPISVSTEANSINFEVKTERGVLSFKGKRTGKVITGDYSDGESTYRFEVTRTIKVEPEKYFGAYKIGPDQFVYIRTWDELGEKQLTYFDDSGNAGPLFATTESNFFTGPSLWIPLPSRTQVEFQSHSAGGISSLIWNASGKAPATGTRSNSIREEDVTFSNGDTRLSGTLVLPDTDKDKYPAVIFVHGSGPVTRDFMGPLPYLFARHGMAVLSYDKRGIGKSGGHWLDADFHALASDALAGLKFLQQRNEIDTSRIGMLGISQGGWILPIAASQSKDVAFLILLSAAAVSPAEQQIHLVSEQMRIGGASTDKIVAAVNETKTQFDQLRSEEARVEFEQQVKKLKEEGKDELLNASGLDNPRFLLLYRKIIDFDPIPVLKKVQCPVLVVYGEMDSQVPVKENKDKLENALKSGGNQHVTVRVIPGADHALLLTKTGSMEEFPYLNRFAPGFFQTLVEWIEPLTK